MKEKEDTVVELIKEIEKEIVRFEKNLNILSKLFNSNNFLVDVVEIPCSSTISCYENCKNKIMKRIVVKGSFTIYPVYPTSRCIHGEKINLGPLKEALLHMRNYIKARIEGLRKFKMKYVSD